jgi:hypothetical protein
MKKISRAEKSPNILFNKELISLPVVVIINTTQHNDKYFIVTLCVCESFTLSLSSFSIHITNWYCWWVDSKTIERENVSSQSIHYFIVLRVSLMFHTLALCPFNWFMPRIDNPYQICNKIRLGTKPVSTVEWVHFVEKSWKFQTLSTYNAKNNLSLLFCQSRSIK